MGNFSRSMVISSTSIILSLPEIWIICRPILFSYCVIVLLYCELVLVLVTGSLSMTGATAPSELFSVKK